MNRIEVNVQTGEQQIIELTAEEIAELQSRLQPEPLTPDYWAFWEALIGSSVYASIREQGGASLPMTVLAVEFITLIGDAKAGRPDEAMIQASMAAILSTGTFTATHLGELQAALAAGNLTDVYTLPGG
jgi:hypothetical protein